MESLGNAMAYIGAAGMAAFLTVAIILALWAVAHDASNRIPCPPSWYRLFTLCLMVIIWYEYVRSGSSWSALWGVLVSLTIFVTCKLCRFTGDEG